jgi:hypothetical protein
MTSVDCKLACGDRDPDGHHQERAKGGVMAPNVTGPSCYEACMECTLDPDCHWYEPSRPQGCYESWDGSWYGIWNASGVSEGNCTFANGGEWCYGCYEEEGFGACSKANIVSGCAPWWVFGCGSVSWEDCEYAPDPPDTIYGCTDPAACNYNAGATDDNGSCEYVEDCAGQCGGNAVEDCSGECGGNSVEDECGVCGGDGSSCEESDDCGVVGGGGSIGCHDHPTNGDGGGTSGDPGTYCCQGTCNLTVERYCPDGGTNPNGYLTDPANCLKNDECRMCDGDGSSCAEDPECSLENGLILSNSGECFAVCSENLPQNRGQRSRGSCEDGSAECGVCCRSTIQCWMFMGIGDVDNPPYTEHPDCKDICEQGDNLDGGGEFADSCNYQPGAIFGAQDEPCRHGDDMLAFHIWKDQNKCGSWNNLVPNTSACCLEGSDPFGNPSYSCDAEPQNTPLDCEPPPSYFCCNEGTWQCDGPMDDLGFCQESLSDCQDECVEPAETCTDQEYDCPTGDVYDGCWSLSDTSCTCADGQGAIDWGCGCTTGGDNGPEGSCDCLGEPTGSYCDCNYNEEDECGVCDGAGPEGSCDCDGNGTDGYCDCNYNVDDECGVCDGSGISGCTDVGACNYDDTATCDDNSCTYPLDDCHDCDGPLPECLNCNGELISEMIENGGPNDNYWPDQCGVCHFCDDWNYYQCYMSYGGAPWNESMDCAGTCHPDDPLSVENCSGDQGWNPPGCFYWDFGDSGPPETAGDCVVGFPLQGFIAQDWYIGTSATHDNGCFDRVEPDNCGFCNGPNGQENECVYDRCLCCPGLINPGGWGNEGDIGYNGSDEDYWTTWIYTSGLGDCVTVAGITDATECEKHLCAGDTYGNSNDIDNWGGSFGPADSQRGIWGPDQSKCPSSVGCGCYNSGAMAMMNNCGCSSADTPSNFVSYSDYNYPGYDEAFSCCGGYCFDCWWHFMYYYGWEKHCDLLENTTPGGVDNSSTCEAFNDDYAYSHEYDCMGVCNEEECGNLGSGDGNCIWDHGHRAGGMLTTPIPSKQRGGGLDRPEEIPANQPLPLGPAHAIDENGQRFLLEPDANRRELGLEFLVEGQSPSPKYRRGAKLKMLQEAGYDVSNWNGFGQTARGNAGQFKKGGRPVGRATAPRGGRAISKSAKPLKQTPQAILCMKTCYQPFFENNGECWLANASGATYLGVIDPACDPESYISLPSGTGCDDWVSPYGDGSGPCPPGWLCLSAYNNPAGGGTAACMNTSVIDWDLPGMETAPFQPYCVDGICYQDYILGDCNWSGTVTTQDADEIFNMTGEDPSLQTNFYNPDRSSAQLCACDVTSSGKLNALDGAKILQYTNGIDYTTQGCSADGVGSNPDIMCICDWPLENGGHSVGPPCSIGEVCTYAWYQ